MKHSRCWIQLMRWSVVGYLRKTSETPERLQRLEKLLVQQQQPYTPAVISFLRVAGLCKKPLATLNKTLSPTARNMLVWIVSQHWRYWRLVTVLKTIVKKDGFVEPLFCCRCFVIIIFPLLFMFSCRVVFFIFLSVKLKFQETNQESWRKIRKPGSFVSSFVLSCRVVFFIFSFQLSWTFKKEIKNLG